MARKRAGRKGGTNQSQFIRDLFAANKNTKFADAKQAWTAAGHKGAIGGALFYAVKRKAGFAKPSKGGKRRGRPPGSANKPANPSSSNVIGYEAVEERLDEVIRLLWDLGDHDLVAEFRVARRKIAAKLA
jgi:hypothetical protein